MTDRFLDKAYAINGTDETRRFYDDWAAGYEDEIGENGYATPGRIAAALARFATDQSTPVLDFGCGTGLSGVALKQAGFITVDGVDLSPEMIARAEAKGIYRSLTLLADASPPPVPKGSCQLVTAVGVIGSGAAPAGVFDDIMALLSRGGLFAFSFNDHTLDHPEYEARVMAWTDTGHARLLMREHGPHLPGIGLGATVYVIARS